MILPVSRVTSRPRSCLASRHALPSWRMISPRLGAGTAGHCSNATCARLIVRSYCSVVAVRTVASNLPSIGEMLLSNLPLPSHSPQNTPGLSPSKPSLRRTPWPELTRVDRLFVFGKCLGFFQGFPPLLLGRRGRGEEAVLSQVFSRFILLDTCFRSIGDFQFAVPVSIRRHSWSIIRSASSITSSVTSNIGRRRI